MKRFLYFSFILLFTVPTLSHSASRYGHESRFLTFGSNIVNAADRGSRSEVLQLLKSGYSANERGEFDTTPLMRASYKNHIKVVELLLTMGADPNSVDVGGASSLHLASRQGHARIVKLLIEHGANIHLEDAEGWTPLLRAVQSKTPSLVSYLIEHQADPFAENQWEQNALTYTAQIGNVEMMKAIFDTEPNFFMEKLSNEQQDHIISIAKNRHRQDMVEYLNTLRNDYIETLQASQKAEDEARLKEEIARTTPSNMEKFQKELRVDKIKNALGFLQRPLSKVMNIVKNNEEVEEEPAPQEEQTTPDEILKQDSALETPPAQLPTDQEEAITPKPVEEEKPIQEKRAALETVEPEPFIETAQQEITTMPWLKSDTLTPESVSISVSSSPQPIKLDMTEPAPTSELAKAPETLPEPAQTTEPEPTSELAKAPETFPEPVQTTEPAPTSELAKAPEKLPEPVQTTEPAPTSELAKAPEKLPEPAQTTEPEPTPSNQQFATMAQPIHPLLQEEMEANEAELFETPALSKEEYDRWTVAENAPPIPHENPFPQELIYIPNPIPSRILIEELSPHKDVAPDPAILVSARDMTVQQEDIAPLAVSQSVLEPQKENITSPSYTKKPFEVEMELLLAPHEEKREAVHHAAMTASYPISSSSGHIQPAIQQHNTTPHLTTTSESAALTKEDTTSFENLPAEELKPIPFQTNVSSAKKVESDFYISEAIRVPKKHSYTNLAERKAQIREQHWIQVSGFKSKKLMHTYLKKVENNIKFQQYRTQSMPKLTSPTFKLGPVDSYRKARSLCQYMTQNLGKAQCAVSSKSFKSPS